MKTLITICLLFTSLSSFSSTCSNYFQSGLKAVNSGLQAYEDADVYLGQAIEGTGRDKDKLCHLLSRSKMKFQSSIDSYKVCYVGFHKASYSCSGEDSDSAKTNMKTCEKNQKLAKEREEHVQENFEKYCR